MTRYQSNLLKAIRKIFKRKTVLCRLCGSECHHSIKRRVNASLDFIFPWRKRLLLDDAVRTNETNVASAWSSLESSRGFLNSVKAQVRAAQIANDGIAAEYERGSRTTLDVIQSNSLLLSAQISLASSEKNYLMAQYNLLKAVGLLNSQYLKLK